MSLAWVRGFLEGTQFARAERHLRSAEIELDVLGRSDPAASDLVIAKQLLEEGRRAIDRGDVDRCWHMLNTANRIIIARRGPVARCGATRVLLIEASKLSKWRREGIESLVTASSVPEPWALIDALQLRDDFFENRYQRISMQREQLTTLLVVSTIAIISILIIAAGAGGFDTLRTWDWRTLVLVLMFGVLGASFSAGRTITKDTLNTLIPELVMSKWITVTRTVLGACPGLAVYAFLQSGLLDLGTINTAKALAIAFAGGFSERLVVKAVETVTGADDAGKK